MINQKGGIKIKVNKKYLYLTLIIPILFSIYIFQEDYVDGIQANNYSEKTKEFYNLKEVTVTKMNFSENLKVFQEIALKSKFRKPKSKLPQVNPDLKVFNTKSENPKFIWFGHSTILMNIDGKIILIDPVFSKNAAPVNFMVKRFQSPVLLLDELPPIDIIVISHNHYDHLDKKTIKFFREKNTKFVVPLGVGTTLKKWGIASSKIRELNWYESEKSKGLNFTATPAIHYSGRGLFDKNKTLWSSWVIESNNKKIFFSGDSGYGNHFKEIGERFGDFDFAFIENGQYDRRWPEIHMFPEETVQAALDLKAKKIIPIHWGMFDLSLHKWNEPIKESYKIAKEKDIPIIIPKLGEIFFEGKKESENLWWDME